LQVRLRHGDIGATKGKGLVGWLSRKLLWPASDRLHFFLIGDYVPWEDDYVIFTSTASKGITVGRLSWHPLEEVEIYRPPWPVARLGRRAVYELTRHGMDPYDYVLIVKLALGALRLLLTGKLPPWRPRDFKYGRDSRFLCTEAANEAWRAVGYPIVADGVCPLPAAFKEAEMAGKIRRIYPPCRKRYSA
jgi:hypothetical protein